VGKLGTVVSIAKGNLSVGGFDGLDDLIVTSETDGLSSVALLLGSPDGMPFSPMFFTRNALVTPDAEYGGLYELDFGFRASALAVGDFDGDGEASQDVAVLTGPGTRSNSPSWSSVAEHHLWLLPVTGDAQIPQAQVTAAGLDSTFADFPPGLDASRALMASLDLGGPSVVEGVEQSELVVLATAVGDEDDLTTMTGALLVASAVQVPLQPDQPDQPDQAFAFQAAQLVALPDLLFGGPLRSGGLHQEEKPMAWSAGGKVEVGDVTGDGNADLLVLAGWVDLTQPDGPLLRTKVVAFPNRRVAELATAIDPATRIELSAGLPQLAGPALDDPTGFATWQADGDPELELVLVTAGSSGGEEARAGRIYLVDPDPAGGVPRSTVELRAGDGRPLAGGSAVSLGDFNGDRLDDLAVVRTSADSAYGALSLLLGQPR
jgi:hypothetical protein